MRLLKRRAAAGVAGLEILLLGHCPPSSAEEPKEAPAAIRWQTDYDMARQRAKADGKLLLLLFTASGMEACEKGEKGALADPDVAVAAGAFVAVKLDIGGKEVPGPILHQNKQVGAKYGAERIPLLVVADPAGEKALATFDLSDPKTDAEALAAGLAEASGAGPKRKARRKKGKPE